MNPCRALAPILLIAASACNADPSGRALPPDDQSAGGDEFCRVSELVLTPACTPCHKPGGADPDLTFDGSQTSLVDVASPVTGAIRVVPGDAAQSFLFRKVSGAITPEEGARMPPTGPLAQGQLDLIEQWIDSGASTACSTPPAIQSVRYHPENFAAAEVHGPALKTQAEDCRNCHGVQLTGELPAVPSCDGCHMAEWRTNCTYCHGGTLDDSGAPPRDLDGNTDLASISFPAHPKHVSGDQHPLYTCAECHNLPTDVLSEGHIFDGTPGTVELTFGPLNAAAAYNAGQCSNLYCHGNGQAANGLANATMPAPGCNDCHTGPSAPSTMWSAMSGEHREHLRHNVACSECHSTVVDNLGQLIDPSQHVNGEKDVVFSGAGINRDNGCTGSCHFEYHQNARW